MRTGILLWLLFFLCPRGFTAVTEREPNNTLEQADSVLCGDTVLCAALSPLTDLDHFAFDVVANDSVVITTFGCSGSQTNTLIALYDLANDSVLAVDDNSGPSWFSRIRFAVSHAGRYAVRVMAHASSADSAYSLAVECEQPPAEEFDFCETARIIEELPFHDDASTNGAAHECGTPAADVFYRFYNPVVRGLYVTLCTGEFDGRLQILGQCCGDFLDDEDQGCDLGAYLHVVNLPIGDYWIMVEGMSASQRGDFSLEVAADQPECVPPAQLVLGTVGGRPFLDWAEQTGPMYFVIWRASRLEGPYEHLGTSFFTYFTDSTGYLDARRFYYVTAVCPW